MALPSLITRSHSGAVQFVPKPVRMGIPAGSTLAQARSHLAELMIHKRILDHTHAIENHRYFGGR